jgi:hypothetical protein
VELSASGTYATGSVRPNQLEIPREFNYVRKFKYVPEGTLAWRMRESHSIQAQCTHINELQLYYLHINCQLIFLANQ